VLTRRRQTVTGWPVAASFGRVLRYHLGSLAFGSLIIAIVQLIRIILAVRALSLPLPPPPFRVADRFVFSPRSTSRPS
jgi:hypothetical protein